MNLRTKRKKLRKIIEIVSKQRENIEDLPSYILSLLFALECLIERRETMVQSKNQKYLFLAFCLLPTLVVFAVFTFYPLANGLYLSFFHWSGTGADKVFAGLDNYKQLIADDIIPKTIWHDYFLVVTKVF